MDRIDINILKAMSENARITISEVSSKVNLSVPAVAERVRRLEAGGVIQKYVSIINPEKMNKKLTAMVFVRTEEPGSNEGFSGFIARENDVLECYYIAGEFDYVLKINTSDTASLEKLLNKIKGIPGVIKTNTVITLSTIKLKYSNISEPE
ncbi:MAG: Lrp/AsnC family transcriptional regulator [Clostridia bacterium]